MSEEKKEELYNLREELGSILHDIEELDKEYPDYNIWNMTAEEMQGLTYEIEQCLEGVEWE